MYIVSHYEIKGVFMAKRGIGHISDEKPVVLDEAHTGTAEKKEVKADVFNKTIRGIPTKLKDDFDDLKAQGKVHGSLNSYMVYALAQQLQRDSE